VRTLVGLGLLCLAAPAAFAHDFNPGVLSLVEREDGRFAMAWTAPVDSSGDTADVSVDFPAPCRRSGELVDCGDDGLAGTVTFTHAHGRRIKIFVFVRWRDGSLSEEMATGAVPRVEIEPRRWALHWLRLGAEPILLGFALLLGLVLVLRPRLDRRLLLTVAAFIAAQSGTLALAALDLVSLPAALAAATIAAGIVLVARESLHDQPTATRRWPWLAAGLFGLVLGLGLASALGLPSGPVSGLLRFAAGLALGQLAVVVLLASVLDRYRRADRAQRGMAYLLGALGMAWFLSRAAALLGA
jgi:hypothetical protein